MSHNHAFQMGGGGGGAAAGVSSFNSRTGNVVPLSGDYTATEVGAVALPSSPATGDVIQWNGSAWVAVVPSTNATELQGIAISATAPVSSDILSYNGTDWVPAAAPASGVSSFNSRTGAVVPASGDYTAAEVSAIALPSSPTTNDLLQWNGTAWVAVPPSSNATEIQGVAISATAPTSGQVLEYNGTDWLPATPSSGGTTLNGLSGAVVLEVNGAAAAVSGQDVVIPDMMTTDTVQTVTATKSFSAAQTFEGAVKFPGTGLSAPYGWSGAGAVSANSFHSDTYGTFEEQVTASYFSSYAGGPAPVGVALTSGTAWTAPTMDVSLTVPITLTANTTASVAISTQEASAGVVSTWTERSVAVGSVAETFTMIFIVRYNSLITITLTNATFAGVTVGGTVYSAKASPI